MDEITLDSGLNEYAFGKTDFSALLTNEGILAEAEGTAGTGTEFTFRPWRFDEIKTSGTGEDAHVVFRGTGFSGQPLAVLFDEAAADGAESRSAYSAGLAAFAVCLALTQAQEKHLLSGITGAGGIFTDCTAEHTRVLFLPAALYNAVCSCGGTELYARNQGVWCSKALAAHDGAAAAFTRAVIAYRALTGHLPYAAADETERNADELDKNYLRLEHAVNGIDKTLADAADRSLELPSLAQQKKAPPVLPVPALPFAALYAELGLVGAEGTLRKPAHPGALPDSEFESKVASYYKAKKQQVNTRRTLRRNTALLTGCLIAAFIITGITVAQHRENGQKPTSMGLTSGQTTAAFYEAVHTQDVELLGLIAKGKDAKRYSDTVSQIYVVNKTRNVYDFSSSMVTPESWLYYQSQETTPEKRNIFGISSFVLDGQNTELDVDVPKRNMNRPPVTVEGTTTLTNGTKAVHTANFYVIHTEGENNDIYVERHTDTVTLTYKRSKWLITGIQSDVTDVPVDSAKFKADFTAECSKTGSDLIEAVEALRTTYPWLPDTATLGSETARQKALRAQYSQ